MSRPLRTLLILLPLIGIGGILFALGPERLRSLGEELSALWGGGGSGEGQVTWCPMDPQVVRKGPGMCPICNMELVPKEAGAGTETGVLVLSSRQIQQAGVRLGVASSRQLVREIDATGRLQVNPAKRRSLTMPFPGTSVVREVYVHAAGTLLHEDQVVLEVHNRELLDLLAEFRGVLKAFADHRRNQRESEAAAQLTRMNELRTQAGIWGLDSTKLNFYASQPKFQFSDPEFPVPSPLAGAVLDDPGLFEGMRIQKGQEILSVADLSELWLYVDLYQHELPFVEVNQALEFTSFAVPDQAFRTTIRAIEPMVQPGTQTVRVRARVPNRDGRLAPGMFVRARIACPIPDCLSVPESSVLQSGRRNVVIVSEGDGRFRPRLVELGRRHLFLAQPEDSEKAFGSDDERYHEIVGGLGPGDRVVVAGNFLLNAEAQFQGILKKMIEADEAQRNAPSLTAADGQAMEAVLATYFEISDALVADEPKRLRALGRKLSSTAADAVEGSGIAATFEALDRDARTFAQRAATQPLDWDALRTAFGSLSRSVVGFLGEYAPARLSAGELHLFRCPMADDFGYELWVQGVAELANPYMGQSMPECGMPAELQ